MMIPTNHKMSTEDVPRPVLNSSRTLHTSRVTNTILDGLPFNVDFVEQPDQFEVGQSFFMPARKVPPVLKYKPIDKENSRQEDTQRWSIAFEDVSRKQALPGLLNQTHQQQRQQQNHRQRSNTTVRHASVSPMPLITFDDDDASGEGANSIISAATPSQFAVYNQSTSNLPDIPVIESRRLRKQAESELERSLAEQSQLIKLLSRRIEDSNGSAQVVKDTTAPDKTTAIWVKRRSDFVPLERTNEFMRGQVPANHLVRHPKSRRPKPPHLSVTKLHLGQVPKMFSQQETPASSVTGFSQPDLGAEIKSANKRQYPESIADLVQSHREQTRSDPKLTNYQYYLPPSVAQQSSDSPSSVDLSGTRVRFAYGGETKPTRVDEPPSMSEEDSSGDTDGPVRELDWRNYNPSITIEPDDDSEDSGTYSRPETIPSASSSFEPYQHQLFTNPIMEYTGRDANKMAAHRYASYSSVQPRYTTRVYRSQKPYDDTYRVSSSHTASLKGITAPEGGSESNPPLHRFSDYHDRQAYELSPRIVPSASHKIIHIHTKEKKSHGKYLWPILGGGLTMLMGFLIISNMLLSIPLLAMGASSLFGHGGYHTQQLVPVYNLSQLARPAGRRRKRWADTELKLAKQRERFEFKTMLRRVMARFAIRNKCRAPGFPPAFTGSELVR